MEGVEAWSRDRSEERRGGEGEKETRINKFRVKEIKKEGREDQTERRNVKRSRDTRQRQEEHRFLICEYMRVCVCIHKCIY